ncbi:MAG: hypothetical protein KME17_14335 [Cyanosarcina radialis HA8281-LM2]|jgi:hypothetical protein|nr:hypothetical protein [Cyanosarcina radialis HA8281-LM2]
MSDNIPKPTSKPYHAPNFTVYGSVSELTNNIGAAGKVADGGVAPTDKTA